MNPHDGALLTILRATINDLVMLGSMTEYTFDEPEAQELAALSDGLPHSAKFFIANRRINQLTRLIKTLEKQPRDDHEF